MSRRIGNWAARHGHAFISTLGHLSRHTLATALTVLAISLALALPLALGVLVSNVRALRGSLDESLGLSVYLKPGMADSQAHQLAARVRAEPGVASVSLISAAQGLALLRTQSGFGAALGSLTDNPLPTVLEVHPAAAAATPQRLDTLRARLAALPSVDAVQLDRAWALRFNAILAVAREALLVSAGLIAAGVIAVIGNTIRLEIQGRWAEIEVTKLVGGSNAFVRRPFLYAGVLYGALAGLLGFGIVLLARIALSQPVAALTAAYGGHFALQGPGLRELGGLVGGGALLGWLGAAVAAGRQLARIEPRAA
ncbi:MAG TPA: permease-like cell division protein FtsX [Steroidobacteraceae bacterium]|nr:permease-like cell division protein FtsX [Steroidobacteraceae bacterium]